MTSRQDVTGEPRWQLAREIVAQLREMPAATAEAEVENRLRNVLGFLFPGLKYPEIAVQYPSGNGPIDVYCRNAVFETKRQGKKDDARAKRDGTTETPEEQAVRYLNALTSRPSLFDRDKIGWRAGITDGKAWSFYDYRRDGEPALTRLREMRLQTPQDDEDLLAYLYDFVNRTAKMAPPTYNNEWVETIAEPFTDLAVACQSQPAFGVKQTLWRDLLRGSFLIPPQDAEEQRDLFARHTMLVVTARSVAETLRQGGQQISDRDALRHKLTDGFAAWLLDAADADGERVLDDLIAEVNRYDWSVAGRDTLKDLYHAVIPRNIRHDFGEYYTPDWLARAVCEEVMDADWRRETIAMAVAGQLSGPAVLDPACGSGTFLYHATQLLLADAAKHPELVNSPEAQVEVVNGLVAGMDLHPVAVELAKTTKIAAFSEWAFYAHSEKALVYMSDSLQWESDFSFARIGLDSDYIIHTESPEASISLPYTFLLNDRFESLIQQIIDYAKLLVYPEIEEDLVSVLSLPRESEQAAALVLYRRMREYIETGRNHVWQWWIINKVQAFRLMVNPPSRLVGNPPWVVYNAMALDRQDKFREQARLRDIWAGGHLATQNDLAATFVATCVDYYLKPGCKFGFVLPYAALKARHWAPFRTGQWSLLAEPGRRGLADRGRTLADLSKAAWNFFAGKATPFPWANSSVIFGVRLDTTDAAEEFQPVPLEGIQDVGNTGPIESRMSWDAVKPLLTFTGQKQWPTAPSPAYAAAFRNGATLFPQPLVVFERPTSRAMGKVYFKTNSGKGQWKGKERSDNIEEQFVKPALFSRHLLPFGAAGHSYVIGPFTAEGNGLMPTLPQGNAAAQFRPYWNRANQEWRVGNKGRPPVTLLDRIDYQRGLSYQLGSKQAAKVVYQRSGVWLQSCVVSVDMIADGTLNWFAGNDEKELHYLAAIFNAPALAIFFRDACRASDKHFQMGPMENLPIPAFDAGNEHHANLAAQSELAHRRVAALVAEYGDSRRKIGRDAVLRDGAMQPILAAIDEAVRVILPDYCS